MKRNLQKAIDAVSSVCAGLPSWRKMRSPPDELSERGEFLKGLVLGLEVL